MSMGEYFWTMGRSDKCSRRFLVMDVLIRCGLVLFYRFIRLFTLLAVSFILFPLFFSIDFNQSINQPRLENILHP